MKTREQKYDVAVIGGGPAGMMAAGRAAECGARVLLVEKNERLGRKLLITGKGRCNITQAEFDDRAFIAALGKNGKFLFSSLHEFGPSDAIDFFEKKGLGTKIERGGRVFPVSDKASDVLAVLTENLKTHGVDSMLGRKVKRVIMKNNQIESIETEDGSIQASSYIIATGGKTYPVTGSTGDGYEWAREIGHTIVPPAPSLVPIKIKEAWVTELQGVSLKNVAITLYQNNKKQDTRFGEMLFTHFGLSGPIILDVSKKIGELLAAGEVMIVLDFKPALEFHQLDQRLLRDFTEYGKKDFKNYLPELLPQKCVESFLALSGIHPHQKLNAITAEERKTLLHLLKELKLTVADVCGFDQAIITSGGVDTREVDSKTMRSKIISNLFFAGEILDLDGPTGGYNLQISWSTGYVAGTHAAASCSE